MSTNGTCARGSAENESSEPFVKQQHAEPGCRMVCHPPHSPSGRCRAPEPATRGGARAPSPRSSPWKFSSERPGAHAWGPRFQSRAPTPRMTLPAVLCGAPLFTCPGQPGGPGAALTPSQDWFPRPHTPQGVLGQGWGVKEAHSVLRGALPAALPTGQPVCSLEGLQPGPASLESGRAGWPSGPAGEAQTR